MNIPSSLNSVATSIAFSWRYGVIGIYKVRNESKVHVYLPFIRLTLGWSVDVDT